jgi:hypothetical protein
MRANGPTRGVEFKSSAQPAKTSGIIRPIWQVGLILLTQEFTSLEQNFDNTQKSHPKIIK